MESTVIQITTSQSNRYVQENEYILAKEFACLPPAAVTTSSNIIQFEIPSTYIAGASTNASKRYFIETDDTVSVIKTRSITTHSNQLLSYANVSYVLVESSMFLLKDDAVFSNVTYINERVDSTVIAWGTEWVIRFQTQWVCPYHSAVKDDGIIFKCRPSYTIEIITTGHPEPIEINRFIAFGLPSYFYILKKSV